MDEHLDQWMEDHINGGYGHILDQQAAEEYSEEDPSCEHCDGEGCDDCLEPYEDDCPLDGDHDSTMESIGWGLDEDYGLFGGEDDFGGDW